MAAPAAPKRSVFPPLLTSYAQTSTHVGTPRQQLATTSSTVPASRVRGREKIVRGKPGSGTCHSEGNTARTTAGFLQRRHNQRSYKETFMEGKKMGVQKQKDQKAEVLVREWDALLMKEKEVKYSELLERINLQRKLIERNDVLAKELRSKEEEKQANKVISEKTARKEMIKELKAHCRRVKEHNMKMTKKFDHGGLDTTPASRSVPRSIPSTTPSESEHDHETSAEEGTERGTLATVYSHYASLENSRLQQLLGFDPVCGATPSIGTAWDVLKKDTDTRMLPLIVESYYLRQFANPTERHILHYYDQPIAQDRESGEPIPLSQVLEEVGRSDIGTESRIAKAVHMRAKKNQIRAETLLQRKGTQLGLLQKDPTMFVPGDVNADSTLPQTSSDRQVWVRHIHSKPEMKKKLPSYLQPDYSTISGSLEEVGERIYCRPSMQKPVEAKGSSHNGDTRKTLSSEKAPKNSRWQPLCCSAALEYEGTRMVPVEGPGPSRHGRYSMWKPMTSVSIPSIDNTFH